VVTKPSTHSLWGTVKIHSITCASKFLVIDSKKCYRKVRWDRRFLPCESRLGVKGGFWELMVGMSHPPSRLQLVHLGIEKRA
jgi:hypothetical protein